MKTWTNMFVLQSHTPRAIAFLLLLTHPIIGLALAGEGDWIEVSEGERLFALQVAPALQAKCAACHGEDPDAIESGFVITNREAVLAGGDSGEAILVPGDRQASGLYLSVTWEHALQMPPKENDRLDADTVEALGQWIDLGAPWPDKDRVAAIRQRLSSGVIVRTSGGLSAAWDERRYEPETLWAYQPLQSVTVPSARPAEEYPASNAIDAFLNARLAELELAPAPRASRRTLIRRLFFDLTGLPPSPEQVNAFVNHPASDELAWSQLVDELLASPHLGERWAQHWLDTVRYADSAGFANDYQRPNAWRYRDYVVRGINEDRPVDRFIQEQIAGDELDPHNPEMLMAVGMLRMGPWEQTGMSVDKVTRQQWLDDVTDMIGQAFLGHPLQCARCHDHKFDPIPTRDYYRIQAVFATTQFAEREAAFLESENRNIFQQQQRYLQQRIATYEALLEHLREKEEAAARQWYSERGWEYASRNQKLKQGIPEDQIAPKKIGYTPKDFGLERIARKYLERHRWELDRYRPLALSVYDGPTPSRRAVNSRIAMPKAIEASGKVEQTAILSGGDPFSPTIPVAPGVFSMLTSLTSQSRTQAPAEPNQPKYEESDFDPSEEIRLLTSITEQLSGRRTAFAQWLTDPSQNPLTPRVLVNRIWQHHFGQGLVATANNFGTAGSPPTHPELLDYLANELVRHAWSAKEIHRLILTSQAYCRAQTLRQASSSERQAYAQELREKDPTGVSYATFKARRLTAEEIRDAVLEVSGLLNREMGGAPIRPDMNQEVAAQPRQIMGTYAPVYQPSPRPEDRNRRTLYALRLRGLRDPMLEVFNQPSPDLPCELRDSSTVAPQALTLFNSPYSYVRALAMAERLLQECGPGDSSLVMNKAFQLAYGRTAERDELDACLQHWQEMTSRHQTLQMQDVLPPAQVTRTFVDENTGQQFSYTEQLEQNQDYEPETRPSQADPRTRGLAEVCLVLLASNEFLYVP